MVTLCLCGLSLLREDDLLLQLCLVYGVGGLLLLGHCLWGERLWVLWRSGVCLHPVFLSLLVCLSGLGCLERLALLSLVYPNVGSAPASSVITLTCGVSGA